MGHHYQTRNHIVEIRIKKLKAQLKEVHDKKMESRKRGKRIKLVTKTSKNVYPIIHNSQGTNFESVGEIWIFL